MNQRRPPRISTIRPQHTTYESSTSKVSDPDFRDFVIEGEKREGLVPEMKGKERGISTKVGVRSQSVLRRPLQIRVTPACRETFNDVRPWTPQVPLIATQRLDPSNGAPSFVLGEAAKRNR
ncbi:hypothetical protein FRC20_008192 [Serendipita sp. 405]|nr:hypothetical protein FRC20_008192 [Serendipita sp. 405]